MDTIALGFPDLRSRPETVIVEVDARKDFYSWYPPVQRRCCWVNADRDSSSRVLLNREKWMIYISIFCAAHGPVHGRTRDQLCCVPGTLWTIPQAVHTMECTNHMVHGTLDCAIVHSYI